MTNFLDPPTGGLDAKTDVAFHYGRRVLWLVVGVCVFVLLALILGNGGGDGFLPQAVGIAFLVFAVLLSLVLLVAVARMRDRQIPPWAERLLARIARLPHWLAVLRWSALVFASVAAAHFGAAASLEGQSKSIVDIELAGSSKAWTDCACDDAFTRAVQQDFWFIACYVLLLVLLALWAGAYFRLPALRRARVTVAIAVVVAGVLDVAENILMLAGGASDGPWRFAAICAWAKFAILLVTVVYVTAGAFAWWSTPRWVRLASWALPVYARKAAATVPKAPPSQEVSQEATGTQTKRGAPPPPEGSRYGIALSGGGIRASSISLGALQALDDGVLGWSGARAVTAVSGGSNLAAGWSISRSGYQTADGGNPARVEPGDLNPAPWEWQDNGSLTPEERHLVDNLGYLASNEPRGSDTDPAATNAIRRGEDEQASAKSSYRPAVFATIIAGLTVNVVVMLSMLWAISRPVGWALRSLTDQDGTLRKGAMHDLVEEHSLALPGIIFLLVGFAVLMLWVLAGRLLIGPAQNHQWARLTLQTLKRAAYAALALGALLAITVWAFVELVGAVAYLSLPALLATAAAGAGVVGSVVRILRKPAARFAPMLGGFAFIVVALGLAALATWTAAKHGVSWSGQDLVSWQSGWNWVLALVIVAAALLGPSPESWALAPFYRGKLRLAYATYRTGDAQDQQRVKPYENDDVAGTDKAKREPGLSAFNHDGTATRTPLVVCTTSTVSSRAVRTHYGTPALSVTFDPERTTLHLPQDGRGNTLEFAASTRVLDRLGNKLHKRITTMMAVAISSAAVSPAMGRYQIGPTSMLLTFFNIRLGVWIANPRFITQLEAAGLQDQANLRYARTGLGYLFKEFFGVHDLDDPYLYLTDGGHWENTGLVELLRISEVTEIVCVDADSGPGDATSSLGKAIAIAPSECDIRIDISLDPLRAAPSGSRVPAYSPRTVNVGFFTKGAGTFTDDTPVGVLWYAKPGLAKHMPAALLAFHERYPTYPRESTLNQFFDTASFVAYRNLGRYNAREILLARQELQQALTELLAIADPATLDEQLTAMASDENSHWAVIELSRAAHSAVPPDGADTAALISAYCRAVSNSLV
ncbi:hypothetical protein [Kribbella shirazensis]|uniref:Patatin-like phospholipase n=1 Tax=Kribbella shirazensis TaxID=1105143 RepID=A0A7X5VES7_9ACTN|nr:hypothetical protein [Kribbella shirazensis]NIK59832.1 hypothetical protein [Kribbella shirazensis]